MSQIILKERTAHLARCTFLQDMLINIKSRISPVYQPPRRPFPQKITSYFRPVNIAKL